MKRYEKLKQYPHEAYQHAVVLTDSRVVFDWVNKNLKPTAPGVVDDGFGPAHTRYYLGVKHAEVSKGEYLWSFHDPEQLAAVKAQFPDLIFEPNPYGPEPMLGEQIIAWAYEATEYGDKTYEDGWKRCVSFEKPFDTTGSVRNVIPLYASIPR